MNLLNSSQQNYRFHAVSRRSKFAAAVAYGNHAAWRRSAAADNTAMEDSMSEDLGNFEDDYTFDYFRRAFDCKFKEDDCKNSKGWLQVQMLTEYCRKYFSIDSN